MSTEEYIDIRHLFSVEKDASYDPISKTVTLTPDEYNKMGAIPGVTKINLQYDFTLVVDVNLGQDRYGGMGMGIALHQGEIGFVGKEGEFGLLGAPKGRALRIYRYNLQEKSIFYVDWIRTEDDPSFGPLHGAPVDFVVHGAWRRLTLKWDAKNEIMALTINSEIEPMKLKFGVSLGSDKKYTCLIGAETSEQFKNKHQIRIVEFDAHFVPRIEAKDITVMQGASFDPLKEPAIDLTANDVIDGEITKKIEVIENTVNLSEPSEYQVTYAVKNSRGESDQKTIKVKVLENSCAPVMDGS